MGLNEGSIQFSALSPALVTSGCPGTQATYVIASASSPQPFSVLGISCTCFVCLAIPCTCGVSLWKCILLVFTAFGKESHKSSHTARKSYSFVSFEPDSHFCHLMVFSTFISRE